MGDDISVLNIKIPDSIDETIKNVTGPTSKQVGYDLKKVYEYGRNNIFKKAWKKIENPNDGKVSNLRVTRDILWNGSYSEEDITAEYFGGVLASSRSKSGKDDSSIFYVDIIKSLSSDQLKTHYLIYTMLHKLFDKEPPRRNFTMGNNAELSLYKIYVPWKQLDPKEEVDLGHVLFGLKSKNLIGDFKSDPIQLTDGSKVPILEMSPTTLGIQLYCIAHNKYDSWYNFPNLNFEKWEGLELPKYFNSKKDLLLKNIGISKDKIIKN
jgi:hypothetical protein